MLKYNR